MQELHRPAREVSLQWRELHALARATDEREGNLGNLTDSGVREELANRHAELLDAYDMPYLDISQVTAENRIVTQTISRDLNETGAARILFHSNRDGHGCLALMEGRAQLVPAGTPLPLTAKLPDSLRSAPTTTSSSSNPATQSQPRTAWQRRQASARALTYELTRSRNALRCRVPTPRLAGLSMGRVGIEPTTLRLRVTSRLDVTLAGAGPFWAGNRNCCP
jgi:hypothetical protein